MKRPCVLVFAGADPSGGAGIQADAQAIAAQGAHPLTVITALTVQDNDRVHAVEPVSAALIQQQALALIEKMDIDAVKIGIAGNRDNALAIAEILERLQARKRVPVVLDTVLASGRGDALARGDAVHNLQPLLPMASLITPNLPEAAALCGGVMDEAQQREALLRLCPDVLLKGGHGSGPEVRNRWYSREGTTEWNFPRLPGSFHGTGCTLASAVAALLATGKPLGEALAEAQTYCHHALLSAYAIADGQRIPNRSIPPAGEHA